MTRAIFGFCRLLPVSVCGHERAVFTAFQKTPDRPEQWSWDDEIATVVVNPFKLGDYSLGRQGVLGDFGGIIPSSNESSLFFVNGNTVVALVSMDPSCSVLSLTEQIDKRLEAVRKNK